jgi:predicted CXXCH cytochrome family protein
MLTIGHTARVKHWILLLEFLVLMQAGCDSPINGGAVSQSGDHRTGKLPLQNKQAASHKTDKNTLVLSALDFTQMKRTRHQAVRPCWNCHVRQSGYRQQAFNQPLAQICYDCHEDYNGPDTYLHGPVGVGACTICHNPHNSSYVSLLRISQPRLCTRCHNTEDFTASETHPNAAGKLCTACHDPHASAHHVFLKEHKDY